MSEHSVTAESLAAELYSRGWTASANDDAADEGGYAGVCEIDEDDHRRAVDLNVFFDTFEPASWVIGTNTYHGEPAMSAPALADRIAASTSAGVFVNTAFNDESAFFEAWTSAVKLAGPGYFGTRTPATARSKWHLVPEVDTIAENLGVLSRGEAGFLAAAVSFYDSEAGGDMLASLGMRGVGDVAAELDEPRRRALADLIVSYSGW